MFKTNSSGDDDNFEHTLRNYLAAIENGDYRDWKLAERLKQQEKLLIGSQLVPEPVTNNIESKIS